LRRLYCSTILSGMSSKAIFIYSGQCMGMFMSPVMNLAFGVDTVLFHNIFDVVKSAVWVLASPG
jgi:hypothetical protein